jgi:hypothetical protein
MARAKAQTTGDGELDAVVETNSSSSTDAVNSPEDRLAADPALEPELAWARDHAGSEDE